MLGRWRASIIAALNVASVLHVTPPSRAAQEGSVTIRVNYSYTIDRIRPEPQNEIFQNRNSWARGGYTAHLSSGTVQGRLPLLRIGWGVVRLQADAPKESPDAAKPCPREGYRIAGNEREPIPVCRDHYKRKVAAHVVRPL